MTKNNSSDLDVTSHQHNAWGPIITVTLGFVGYGASLVVSLLVAVISFSVFGESVKRELSFNLVLLIFSDAAFLAVIFAYLAPQGAVWQKLGLIRARLTSFLYIVPASIGYVITTAVLVTGVSIAFPNLNLDEVQDLPFVHADAISELIIAAVALLIIAPVAEELVFRGFIFKGFRNKTGFIGATVISSIIFGIAHGQLNVALDTFALGLFLCYVYEKTGSLWTSIALHSLKNGVAFYLLFFTDMSAL
jgi:membrane protease YdiL (CAAX protease family)